jgi:hypothetical protein
MDDVTVRRVDFGCFVRPPEETGTGEPRVEPCLKVMGIFKSMDKFLGPDFQRGLCRLKTTTEKSAGN